MKRKCKTCGIEFEGEHWKVQCYDCYKNFKGRERIRVKNPRRGVYIETHPGVTKEEVDEFIKKTFGSVNDPSNWGAVRADDSKMILWYNCQDTD